MMRQSPVESAPPIDVFIVENSIFLQERLGHLITGMSGVRIVGYAAGASDAVVKISETNPAVIILDIRLDQGTGFDVLKEVRLWQSHPIIIVFTNYSFQQYRDKYLGAGADYFYDKSTEVDAVLGVLNSLRGNEPPPRNQAANDI